MRRLPHDTLNRIAFGMVRKMHCQQVHRQQQREEALPLLALSFLVTIFPTVSTVASKRVQSRVAHGAHSSTHRFLSRCCSCPCLFPPPFSFLFFAFAFSFTLVFLSIFSFAVSLSLATIHRCNFLWRLLRRENSRTSAGQALASQETCFRHSPTVGSRARGDLWAPWKISSPLATIFSCGASVAHTIG